MIEFKVRYHGEFAIDNIGPCAMDEVFFPSGENSNRRIGSCYRIKPNAKVRFEDANDVCLDSSGKGSLRSPFSRRDPEFDLLLGALDFLHETTEANYDRTAADFEHAKERVWEGFQIANAHYIHPQFYADGTSVTAGDIGSNLFPSSFSEHSWNAGETPNLFEYSDQYHMKRRHPSSHCFTRSWGNHTLKLYATPLVNHHATSKIVCQGKNTR